MRLLSEPEIHTLIITCHFHLCMYFERFWSKIKKKFDEDKLDPFEKKILICQLLMSSY